MASGSCYCGKIKISYTKDPIITGLCHCMDCRKLTSGAYSVNVIVPADGFTVEGTPKSIIKTSDSGATIINHFCGDCGTALWGTGGFGENKVVRAGILDGDALEKAKPAMEVFAERRVSWLKEVEGATSVQGMSHSQVATEEAVASGAT